MDNGNPHRVLTREQKTGFVLLLIFGFLAIGLGILQMRNNLFKPFVIRLSNGELEEESLFADQDVRLQSIDTDHDGLNDFEELNFYETSPYLPDTDSDGIGDKVEIENGTDPLCPKGENCETKEDISDLITDEAVKSPLLSDGNGLTELVGPVTTGQAASGAQSFSEFEQILNDPTKLRELLAQSGVLSQDQLANIDDKMLKQLVEEAVKEQGGWPTSTSTNKE